MRIVCSRQFAIFMLSDSCVRIESHDVMNLRITTFIS
jgi:hypothetical protein